MAFPLPWGNPSYTITVLTQAALPDGQSAHASCWPSSTSRAPYSHSTPCLSLRHVICLGTDLCALTHRFATFCTFCVSLPATSVTPRCIRRCLTAAGGSVQHRVCKTPASPEILIPAVIASPVVCDLGPSLTAGEAECLRLLFHLEKGGMVA